jgi:hypothetical protein
VIEVGTKHGWSVGASEQKEWLLSGQGFRTGVFGSDCLTVASTRLTKHGPEAKFIRVCGVSVVCYVHFERRFDFYRRGYLPGNSMETRRSRFNLSVSSRSTWLSGTCCSGCSMVR